MVDMITGIYKITYQCGVVQYKNLISHDFYINTIIPLQNKVHDIEVKGKKNWKSEASFVKGKIKKLVGSEWFTDKSPLFESIESGLLILPIHQGGIHKCKVESI